MSSAQHSKDRYIKLKAQIVFIRSKYIKTNPYSTIEKSSVYFNTFDSSNEKPFLSQ
jgi:hypothetical protein